MNDPASKRPMTAPISPCVISAMRVSASARTPSVSRKRFGSATRHITTLLATMFFLSSLRNSASTGRVNKQLLVDANHTVDRRLEVQAGGRDLAWSTRPKRMTTPYSVTSTTKQEALSAHRPQAAARIASVRTSAGRLFPPSRKIVALVDTALPASARGNWLQEPEVEILHLSGTGPNDFLHALGNTARIVSSCRRCIVSSGASRYASSRTANAAASPSACLTSWSRAASACSSFAAASPFAWFTFSTAKMLARLIVRSLSSCASSGDVAEGAHAPRRADAHRAVGR